MFDDLQEILSSIGVAKLSDYLGHDRCDLLEGLGIPIVANELARAIITSDGINCLKNKELRYAILRAQKSEEEAIAVIKGTNVNNTKVSKNAAIVEEKHIKPNAILSRSLKNCQVLLKL